MAEEAEREDEFAVPNKGDVLFGSDSALWQMEAVLDMRPGSDHTYREGYRLAGRILADG